MMLADGGTGAALRSSGEAMAVLAFLCVAFLILYGLAVGFHSYGRKKLVLFAAATFLMAIGILSFVHLAMALFVGATLLISFALGWKGRT